MGRCGRATACLRRLMQVRLHCWQMASGVKRPHQPRSPTLSLLSGLLMNMPINTLRYRSLYYCQPIQTTMQLSGTPSTIRFP
ncbi:hypothetical protein FGO68_gene8010 [Halteria grandinella]|uniref:Uncharacterized protein n=1 Tax=Halteria grandinella TaxID=5974 RepID=A0A8J8TBA6_HALGN|nr:hypothetical protein FGO68_gene8010 [Halteria grandinella]